MSGRGHKREGRSQIKQINTAVAGKTKPQCLAQSKQGDLEGREWTSGGRREERARRDQGKLKGAAIDPVTGSLLSRTLSASHTFSLLLTYSLSTASPTL